jgi:urease accessory protein
VSQSDATTLRINHILGGARDSALDAQIHRLSHRGAVDTLLIAAADVPRRRFRATSEAGRTIEIALPRAETLFDGAVLWLDDNHALVLRVAPQRWLRLRPRTSDDALALGYHAGNLHWRVRFAKGALLVALEAPAEDYLARLGALATPGRLHCDIVDHAPC